MTLPFLRFNHRRRSFYSYLSLIPSSVSVSVSVSGPHPFFSIRRLPRLTGPPYSPVWIVHGWPLLRSRLGPPVCGRPQQGLCGTGRSACVRARTFCRVLPPPPFPSVFHPSPSPTPVRYVDTRQGHGWTERASRDLLGRCGRPAGVWGGLRGRRVAGKDCAGAWVWSRLRVRR